MPVGKRRGKGKKDNGGGENKHNALHSRLAEKKGGALFCFTRLPLYGFKMATKKKKKQKKENQKPRSPRPPHGGGEE